MAAPMAQQPETAAAIEWSHDLGATLQAAAAAKAPTLVFFTASWCVPCQELKAQVFAKPDAARAFAGWRFAMVDIDQHVEVKAHWQVQPIPDIRFVAADGEELGGFVGNRSLDAVLQARDAALQSGARARELRAAVAAQPGSAAALLALAEHLLQRPNKAPGVAALERVVAAAPDSAFAARAHWQIVGASLPVLGRATPETLADAERRLQTLQRFGDDEVCRHYRDAVQGWLWWSETMRAWNADRQAAGKRDEPLTVAADAPLRALLRGLATAALAQPDGPGADAAADGLLLDGMLHYYGRDLAVGHERLLAFTRAFPGHRWHGEGQRFLGITSRLLREQPKK